MVRTWRVVAVVGLALALGCGVPHDEDDAGWEDHSVRSAPPSYAPQDEPRNVKVWDHGVLRAQVDTTAGTIDVPSFVVRWRTGGNAALVTAHRAFGPTAGLARQYPAAELPQLVRGVRAHSVTGEEVVTSGTFVPMPLARPATSGDASLDIAAWSVPMDSLNARYQLGLAGKPPLRGERVYLAVDVTGSTRVIHNAMVEEVAPLVFRYRVWGTVDLSAAAGAPILDTSGAVVGMHVSATHRDGDTYAEAVPASAIGAELQRAA